MVLYWITATVFSILCGEIAGPLLARHPLPILEHTAAFITYYRILSAIFAMLLTRSVPLSLVVFFFYGIAAELLLFNNIGGVTDMSAMLFFGTFYVFLFGTPIWIAKKINEILPVHRNP
jgi:hypothetical protein